MGQAMHTLVGDGTFKTVAIGAAIFQERLQGLSSKARPVGIRSHVEAKALLLCNDAGNSGNQAIDVLIDGQLVGFLGFKTALALRRHLHRAHAKSNTATCNAVILGEMAQGASVADFRVRLDLPLD